MLLDMTHTTSYENHTASPLIDSPLTFRLFISKATKIYQIEVVHINQIFYAIAIDLIG